MRTGQSRSMCVVGLGLMGCTSTATVLPVVPDADVTIQVVSAVRAEPLVGVLDLTVKLDVTNAGTESVHYDHCSTSLERRSNGTWEPKWYRLCIPVTRADRLAGTLEIEPGTTRQVTLRVVAYPRESGWPSSDLEGEYRVRTVLGDPLGRLIPSQMGVSNAFSMPIR